MDRFFKKTIHAKIHRQNGEIVDLTTIPADAFELYVSGFNFLELKPEAETLFLKISTEKINELIEVKKEQKKASDVAVLEKVLKAKIGSLKKNKSTFK